MKVLVFSLVALLLIQVFVEVISVSDQVEPSVTQVDGTENIGALHKKHHDKKINCSSECARRCSKSSRKNVCHRACKTCCERCNCVPPGTYGNKELCPCYANQRTHGNKPKCP